MLNFLPKRLPSINLLHGKRPLQRIEVGHGKHRLEIPLSVVDQLYQNVDETKHYHNGDYNPLKWKTFMNLKLKAYYLYEASRDPRAAKTALRQLEFYPKLTALYKAQLRNAQTEVMELATRKPAAFRLPIQGKNIFATEACSKP